MVRTETRQKKLCTQSYGYTTNKIKKPVDRGAGLLLTHEHAERLVLRCPMSK